MGKGVGTGEGEGGEGNGRGKGEGRGGEEFTPPQCSLAVDATESYIRYPQKLVLSTFENQNF